MVFYLEHLLKISLSTIKLIIKKVDLVGEQLGHILSKRNNYSGDNVITAFQIANFCRKRNITLKNLLKTSFKVFTQKLNKKS